MRRLENTIRFGLAVLEKEIVRKVGATIRDSRLWRGKKLVPIIKWESMKKKKGAQYEMLEHIPEGFVDHLFHPAHDEELQKKRNEWYKDYVDFLEEKKFPDYGRSKCWGCILNPDYRFGNHSLREILLKGVKDNKNPVKSPCQVVNIFQCPYEQGEKSSLLFALNDIWKIIEDALKNAYTKYPIEDDLIDLRNKIKIRNINDIFNALTNRDSLEAILEQYANHLKKNIRDTKKRTPCKDTDDLEYRLKSLEEMKKPILDYIMSLKKKIKLEEIRDFEGRNLEEEKQYFKELEEQNLSRTGAA